MSRRNVWFDLWGATSTHGSSDDPEDLIRIHPNDILISDVSSGARLCLIWIKFLACYDELEAYNATLLAADLSVSVGVVSSWLKELREANLLSDFNDTWLLKTTIQQVYFIQSTHGGPIKIGCAADPIARLLQLQTAHSDLLVILATMPGGMPQEQRLHQQFAISRIQGEWFDPSADLIKFIESIK